MLARRSTKVLFLLTVAWSSRTASGPALPGRAKFWTVPGTARYRISALAHAKYSCMPRDAWRKVPLDSRAERGSRLIIST